MTEDEEKLSVLEDVRRASAAIQKTILVRENGFDDEIEIEREGIGPLITPYGRFQFYSFKANDRWRKYSVLVKAPAYKNFYPKFDEEKELIVRIDSGCETGQVFTDLTCECVDQLYLALYEIALNGQGVLVNIPMQDGRGMGLPFKLATLTLQDRLGVDTVESSVLVEPNGSRDRRTYGSAIAILKFLGIESRKVVLNSNNPQKKSVFEENGFETVNLPSIIEPTTHTERHLSAKGAKLGHDALLDSTESFDKPNLALRLNKMIERDRGLFCCGLDPDITKIPASLNDEFGPSYAIQSFLKEVVDQTIDLVSAYKIQKAFFDQVPGGERALRATIRYVRKRDIEIPIFLDSKVGDIENTMKAYESQFFEDLKVDAAVINPLMGTDVLDAFEEKVNGGLVLVRTSNKGAAVFQDALLADGKPYWTLILKEIIRRRRLGQNLVPVIGGLTEESWQLAIHMLGDSPVFFAGAGTQGADLEILPKLTEGGRQVFVNSSRAILFGTQEESSDTWVGSIRARAERFAEKLRAISRGGTE